MSAESTSSFAEQLRRLREAAGLTQKELAERAGLTRDAIGALERGLRRRPYLHTVRTLSVALDLSEEQRQELHASVPGRKAVSQPAVALQVPSLPAPPTPLIGRERETAQLRRLLTGTSGYSRSQDPVVSARPASPSRSPRMWLRICLTVSP